MNAYEKKLAEYMKENNVGAEHLIFEQTCHSVSEAASAVGVTAEDFIKSICMNSSKGDLIVTIVKGEDRASLSKVRKALNIKRPWTLSPEEILAQTGYPVGGVPPFGYNATFLIDERVLQKEIVFGGGGSEKALIKISPEELKRANEGAVKNIRK